MADAPLLDMDYLSWSRHYRNFPGQGDLPIDEFMRALLATGYDGLLSLEIFNDQFRAGSARSVAIDGHRSLITMLDDLRAECPDAGRLPPPLPRTRSVWARSSWSSQSTRKAPSSWKCFSSGLGFSKTGQHISKSVSRWNQGQINIVVNTEKEGFAHSFNILHGTSVCAMALQA